MVYSLLRPVKDRIDKTFGPLMIRAYSWGLRPVHLTMLSLPTGLIGVWCLFNGPAAGSLFVLGYVALDIADGTMARSTGTATRAGATLDFLIDATIACSFLLGLFFFGINPHLALFGIIMLLACSMEEVGLIRR